MMLAVDKQGYRARNRAAGLRLIRLWVPDTRSKGFAAECRRQRRLLKGDRPHSPTADLLIQPARLDAVEHCKIGVQ